MERDKTEAPHKMAPHYWRWSRDCWSICLRPFGPVQQSQSQVMEPRKLIVGSTGPIHFLPSSALPALLLIEKYRFVEIIIRRMRFGELFNEDF